jgi:hypothetical protein
MGLFGKLKENMHGGVQVHVQAPSSVPGNQVIPVTVTLSADSTQTVNSVKAEIKAQAREQGLSIGGGNMGGGHGMGVNDERTMHQTVAQVESREAFTINPGETKTVNLQLYLNGSAGSGNPLAQLNTGGGALGGAIKAMATAAQAFDHINYIYTVHASADVQGVHMAPSDKQPIQILPPTESAPAAQPVQPAAAEQPGQTPAPPLPIPPVPVIPIAMEQPPAAAPEVTPPPQPPLPPQQ